MVKTLYTYRIAQTRKGKDSLPSFEPPYSVAKLDADLELVAEYMVHVERHKYKDDERVFVCTCPSYKAICKHVHWVKAFRRRQESSAEPLSCAYFNPATAELEVVTEGQMRRHVSAE